MAFLSYSGAEWSVSFSNATMTALTGQTSSFLKLDVASYLRCEERHCINTNVESMNAKCGLYSHWSSEITHFIADMAHLQDEE